MTNIHTLIVEDVLPQRLDSWLSLQFETLTRSRLQSLIKQECVTVNQKIAKSSQLLKPQDIVVVSLPPLEPLALTPENIPLDIYYEDEQLLVINKAKDMTVHPAPGAWSGTLVHALLYHCQDLSGIGGVLRPGIVHRLDKDTSGLMLVAKTDLAHQHLAKQIADKTVERKYWAIVKGHLAQATGTINLPIGRHPRDRIKMGVVSTGKPAVTHYTVIQQLKGHDWIECVLETGRTHQIRVHLSHLGHPIIGDEVYGGKSQLNFKFEGQTLHSHSIGFEHPVSGEYLTFNTPVPDRLGKLLSLISPE
jgi:23S rRNA pseudouridine1911/1915/1917 synthase